MNIVDGIHLTYCSNIHAGESWPEVSATLAAALPAIRRELSFDAPFAVGLRLSAAAAQTLEEPATLSRFRDFLKRGNYYVPTINGFPYGSFHNTRVKERVYLPDWRSPDRVDYSNRLASILATLLSDRPNLEGSISSVPVAFRADVRSDDDIAAAAIGILSHAAYLKRLCDASGISIALALEPEPACLLETAADAVAFFEDRLFDSAALRTASRQSGIEIDVDDVRAHVGVCLDVCHMAVEFEDPSLAIDQLTRSGIGVRKVQLSSALRLQTGRNAPAPRDVLGRFADDTYLHQVVVRGRDGLVRYTDLPDALADHVAADQEEWRVHCHVPIFLADMHETGTTQAYLGSVLELVRRHGLCNMLEVETYTWDVLPAQYRSVDVCTAIARERSWVIALLQR